MASSQYIKIPLVLGCAPKGAQAKIAIPSVQKHSFQGACLRRRRLNEEQKRYSQTPCSRSLEEERPAEVVIPLTGGVDS